MTIPFVIGIVLLFISLPMLINGEGMNAPGGKSMGFLAGLVLGIFAFLLIVLDRLWVSRKKD